MENLLKKKNKQKANEKQKRAAMRRRIANSKARLSQGSNNRKDRCLSKLLKKKEAEQMKGRKKSYLPPEMSVGLYTVSANSQLWNKSNFNNTSNFMTASNPVRMNTMGI